MSGRLLQSSIYRNLHLLPDQNLLVSHLLVSLIVIANDLTLLQLKWRK